MEKSKRKCKKIILAFCFVIITSQLYSQSDKYVDSLRNNNCKEIIVLKKECFGCLTLQTSCEDYGKNGNFEDEYLFWRSNKKTYLKRINVCGTSKNIEIKKWNKNPFDWINIKSTELDTIRLQYPLTLTKDSIWVEGRLSHNQIYTLSFPTYGIHDIEINSKAFNDLKMITKEIEDYGKTDPEFAKNIHRYLFNNTSSVKELLDVLNSQIKEAKSKIRIKSKNHFKQKS